MELMNWIRDRRFDLSVIVVSGDESIESAITALRCGAREYIRKPFDPAVLRGTVDNALSARKLAYETAR